MPIYKQPYIRPDATGTDEFYPTEMPELGSNPYDWVGSQEFSQPELGNNPWNEGYIQDYAPAPGPGDVTQYPSPSPSPAPSPTQYGSTIGNTGYMEWGGIDANKFNDTSYMSPKYQVLRTLSGFDPNKGVTPEVLAALNTLGLGDFTGSGDNLYVGGSNLSPEWNGYTAIDVIRDEGGGNDLWGYGSWDPNAPQQQAYAPMQFQMPDLTQFMSQFTPLSTAATGWSTEPGIGMQGGSLPPITSTGQSSGGGYNYAPSVGPAQQTTPTAMPSPTQFSPVSVNYGGGAGPQQFAPNGVASALESLFKDGGFNDEAVRLRTTNAVDQLERMRQSRLATNQASLASRGLIGSGPETTGINGIDESTYDLMTGAVNDINAAEREAADARRMQALQIGAGLTAEQARNAVDWFNAQTTRGLGEGQLALGQNQLALNRDLGFGQLNLDRDLGFGNLALGNRRADIDYALGQGNLALGGQRLDLDRLLGMGQLDLDRYLGTGNLALGNKRADQDYALGQGNLNLGYTRAANDYALGQGNLALGYQRAGQDYSLGQGNLALGNLNAVNNYNLGLANYGLNRDQFLYGTGQDQMSNYLDLLRIWLGTQGNSAGGSVE